MQDDEAQFYVAVADLCNAASLAGALVEVLTAAGDRVRGVPKPAPVARSSEEELDDTGYARSLLIDDSVIDLADVRRCCIMSPLQ